MQLTARWVSWERGLICVYWAPAVLTALRKRRQSEVCMCLCDQWWKDKELSLRACDYIPDLCCSFCGCISFGGKYLLQTDEKTEVQKDRATCSRSCDCWMERLGLEPSSVGIGQCSPASVLVVMTVSNLYSSRVATNIIQRLSFFFLFSSTLSFLTWGLILPRLALSSLYLKITLNSWPFCLYLSDPGLLVCTVMHRIFSLVCLFVWDRAYIVGKAILKLTI